MPRWASRTTSSALGGDSIVVDPAGRPGPRGRAVAHPAAGVPAAYACRARRRRRRRRSPLTRGRAARWSRSPTPRPPRSPGWAWTWPRCCRSRRCRPDCCSTPRSTPAASTSTPCRWSSTWPARSTRTGCAPPGQALLDRHANLRASFHQLGSGRPVAVVPARCRCRGPPPICPIVDGRGGGRGLAALPRRGGPPVRSGGRPAAADDAGPRPATVPAGPHPPAHAARRLVARAADAAARGALRGRGGRRPRRTATSSPGWPGRTGPPPSRPGATRSPGSPTPPGSPRRTRSASPRCPTVIEHELPAPDSAGADRAGPGPRAHAEHAGAGGVERRARPAHRPRRRGVRRHRLRPPGRSCHGVESMIGLFINTVPVRVRIDPAEPVGALLARLQDEQSALLDHQLPGTGRHPAAGRRSVSCSTLC